MKWRISPASLDKAKAAGATVLVEPYLGDDRQAGWYNFPAAILRKFMHR